MGGSSWGAPPHAMDSAAIAAKTGVSDQAPILP